MKLHEIRAKKGRTQWDLRLLTGIHQVKISLIESGYVLPTDEERMKLAQALGVAPGALTFKLKSFGDIIDVASGAVGQDTL
ncbi:MAG: helix-turn-helix protein [Syntrophus sp. PtaB.Bin138]|nr:MAG: helix-turn-helix protein [Syntrophus sp. PtaB.Bin138]